MAQDNNLFALLADEEGDDVMKLITRVKEVEKQNSSLVEKVQKEMKEEKTMTYLDPTDLRAKPLILPTHVRRSFIVFDKKKAREEAEAEARRKAEDEVKTGEQPLNGNFTALDNSKEGQSTKFHGYQMKNRASYNVRRNGYQQSNGYNVSYEGKYGRANGYLPNNGGHYKGSYKGSNGNQHYNSENGVPNGLSNYDQLNNGGEYNGNTADDGWQYVGRRHHGKRRSGYHQYSNPDEDCTRHGSLEECNNSEKDSGKYSNVDENGDMTNTGNLAGEEAMENKVQGYLHLTAEGQEDAQFETSSFNKEEGKSCVISEGQEDAQSEKKSNERDDDPESGKKSKNKNKNKKNVTQDNVEKNQEKEQEEEQNFMTLEEYEKKKCEARKSLEAFKRPEQRKVEDTDFESMQLIGKKKEDGQLKHEDKLKKKDNMEQKSQKASIINEIFKPAQVWTRYKHRQNGDRPNGRQYTERSNGMINGENHNGRGHGGRKPYVNLDEDGEKSNNQHDSERPPAGAAATARSLPPPTFDIEHHQFPALRASNIHF